MIFPFFQYTVDCANDAIADVLPKGSFEKFIDRHLEKDVPDGSHGMISDPFAELWDEYLKDKDVPTAQELIEKAIEPEILSDVSHQESPPPKRQKMFKEHQPQLKLKKNSFDTEVNVSKAVLVDVMNKTVSMKDRPSTHTNSKPELSIFSVHY